MERLRVFELLLGDLLQLRQESCNGLSLVLLRKPEASGMLCMSWSSWPGLLVLLHCYCGHTDTLQDAKNQHTVEELLAETFSVFQKSSDISVSVFLPGSSGFPRDGMKKIGSPFSVTVWLRADVWLNHILCSLFGGSPNTGLTGLSERHCLKEGSFCGAVAHGHHARSFSEQRFGVCVVTVLLQPSGFLLQFCINPGD